jgi:SAM-dependent methyltransferase
MKGQCFDLTDRSGIKYDDWLGAFLPVLKSARTPVIDLGCGSGNDTLYLVENNIRVIPCDISAEIVSNIRRNFPELDRVEQFDMTHGLLFPDGFSDVIIADLSLHFFDEQTTFFVLDEIKRILSPRGILLFRVNSLKDARHGGSGGTEISHGLFRLNDGRMKRFFDEAMITHFFRGWELSGLSESVMHRYVKPKTLWTAMARPILP